MIEAPKYRHTEEAVEEMINFPLNLNQPELTLVYIICYFDVIEGLGEEISAEFALLRFIEQAQHSSQRGGKCGVSRL